MLVLYLKYIIGYVRAFDSMFILSQVITAELWHNLKKRATICSFYKTFYSGVVPWCQTPLSC